MIYTVGHGKNDIKEFMDVLKKHKIRTLIDVRSIPRSRWVPAYNRQKLEVLCPDENIEYIWRGKSLGGFGEIPHEFFMKGISELVERGKEDNIIIMCSESDYTKCHRYQKITPELEKAGVAVTHLKVEKKRDKFEQKTLV